MPRPIYIANRRNHRLWWRVVVALLLWVALALPPTTAAVAIYILRQWAADLPAIPNLERWDALAPRTSTIVAADGTLLAEIPFQDGAAVGHRFLIRYDEIPTLLVQAILAAEDERFFTHPGVDFQAVVRAALANYRAGRIVEGASTITQQVARNLLPDSIGTERSLRRKLREAILARRIERHYSKQRIFEVYANHAFLGAGAYGVTAAARAYFNRRPTELDLPQVALIAGLAQAPGRADPYLHLEDARARRDEVLERMWLSGFIVEQAYREAAATPIELSPPPLRYGALAPWHTEWVRRTVEAKWPDAYRRGGLTIETSAAPLLSVAAEEKARRRSEQLTATGEPPPEVAALIWDHVTGYVEATVGGRAWAESRFDRAAQACRQPGSAWKPIVYAAALAHDVITPGTALRDAPVAEYDWNLDVHWKPTNSGRPFRGVALAQDALAASLNAPAIDVFDLAGGPAVIAMARRLGITTEIADVRPLALGSSCVIPLELARVFAVFARGGVDTVPVFAVRVRRGGHVLVDAASALDPNIDPARRLDRFAALAAATAAEPLLDARTAFLLTNMLRDVVLRGTATAARALPWPAAGKTGTTNGHTDAWFVGFTARAVFLTWLGHDDPARSLGHGHDGAHAALPLWMELVRIAEFGRTPAPVPGAPPDGLVRARIDRETGLLAQPGAGGAADLYFKRGTEPKEMSGHPAGVPLDLSRTTRSF